MYVYILGVSVFNSEHQLTFIPERNVCFGVKLIKTMLFSKRFRLPSVLGIHLSSTLYKTFVAAMVEVTSN